VIKETAEQPETQDHAESKESTEILEMLDLWDYPVLAGCKETKVIED